VPINNYFEFDFPESALLEVRGPDNCTRSSRLLRRRSSGTGAGLGVMVMVMVTMVVPSGGEHRACTNQQQNGGNNQLLHAMKIA